MKKGINRTNRNICINITNRSNGSISSTIPTDIRTIVETFLADQQILESSRRTYREGISDLLHWCRRKGLELDRLGRGDLLAYIGDLSRLGYSVRTISVYTVSIRRFFAYIEARGWYTNIAEDIRTPRKPKGGFVRMHLERDERMRLLDYARERGPRDFAMVNLMLRNGLRTMEVTRLNIGDILLRKGVRVLAVWRKGAITRSDYVALTDEAYGPIHDYIETRPEKSLSSPLFVSEGDGHRGERLTPRRVQQIVKGCLLGIGLSSREYTPHSLRHTTAVAILESGGSIYDVKTVLGHSSIATSQIYTESIEEELRLRHPPEDIIKGAFSKEN